MNKNLIENWNVDDETFWKNTGSSLAYQNLWVSIPALFLAFATWMMWSIIIVEMQNLGFTLGESDPQKIKALLYSLPAIAGLAGSTLRIPNSFLIAIGGGRNVIFVTTLGLLLAALGTGIALQSKDTPYFIFAIMATLSGIGGGNFSSSMANITSFFPKKLQGTALGLNAGIGNLGVSGMQFLLPITMQVALFGTFAGPALFQGERFLFIQNAGLTWVPFIAITLIFVWAKMHNLKSASPELKTTAQSFKDIFLFLFVGMLTSFLGAYFLVALKWNIFIILVLIVVLTLLGLKIVTTGSVKKKLEQQFEILKNKHNWVMTIIYVMTFGSFIGYAASFPKLIQDVFGYLPDGSLNPHAPNPMAWAFLGPLLGACIRPIGGWLADKIGSGSRVTAWSTVIQIVGAIGAAYAILQAKTAIAPEDFWPLFFISFMFLFIGSGIGNGSTFRSIPYIFPKEMTPSVLGWTAAIGAYGSFVIPKIFGEQIANKTPEYALYGFCLYYIVCLILNWFFYDRKNSEIKC